jgi:hypothetical protein
MVRASATVAHHGARRAELNERGGAWCTGTHRPSSHHLHQFGVLAGETAGFSSRSGACILLGLLQIGDRVPDAAGVSLTNKQVVLLAILILAANFLVTPCLGSVVDDGGTEAHRRVDARAGDRDGGQVHHEHRETDRQGSQDLRDHPLEQGNR